MIDEKTTRECPYCKEEIKAEAIKCKHCKSNVSPEKPAHEGVCPYCKEEIKPEAIKCKHCGSMLNDSSESGCEGCSEKDDLSQFDTRMYHTTSNRIPIPTDNRTWCSSCYLVFDRGRPRSVRQCCRHGVGCWTQSCDIAPWF